MYFAVFITSAKEVLNARPFACPSVCPSLHQFVSELSRITLILLITLFWKKFNSKGIYVIYIVFSFIHLIVWIQKIIHDPDWPIDFIILGGAKNFRIGRGMHSQSSCFILWWHLIEPTFTISNFIFSYFIPLLSHHCRLAHRGGCGKYQQWSHKNRR